MKRVLFLIIIAVFSFAIHAGDHVPKDKPICQSFKNENKEANCISFDVARYRCQDGTWSQWGICPNDPPKNPKKDKSAIQLEIAFAESKSKCRPCEIEELLKISYTCKGYKCQDSDPPKTPEEICMKNGGVYLGNGVCKTSWPGGSDKPPVDNSFANLVKKLMG